MAEFTGCENCVHANEEHKLVTGTIPLTGALGDKFGQAQIAHLEPEVVVPYLQKNLHWRLQKVLNPILRYVLTRG
jgi:tyrosinase